ncbi:hypothetical protein R1flu_011113 [Riccia fluitans]|uniref:procollagen-proline 3-dioxygenase n=1 Tax=Riccia fluitans TaxID=41844 RepID=A0ABD1Z6W2_9MARC
MRGQNSPLFGDHVGDINAGKVVDVHEVEERATSAEFTFGAGDKWGVAVRKLRGRDGRHGTEEPLDLSKEIPSKTSVTEKTAVGMFTVKMDGNMAAHRLLQPEFLSPEECKELQFIHKSCCVVGYRPWVLSTTLCHLVATNSANLILPLLPIRERVKELVEEYFGREYELFVEFTGLISWTKGANIGWHSDDNRPYLRQRHYSAVCYLNNYGEDFEGGLFHFENGAPETVVPTAGTIVIYAADEKNSHRVDEITDGERCTLALWFTLDKAHDEDEKLLQQLAFLDLHFSDEMSHENLGQGEGKGRLPISASSVMYSINANVQRGEAPGKEPPTDEQPMNDLRIGRMARLGYSCCFSSGVTWADHDQPVEVFFGEKKIPVTFWNLMHALQVVQFHQYKVSMREQDSPVGEEQCSGRSELEFLNSVYEFHEKSPSSKDILGEIEGESKLVYHLDARLKPEVIRSHLQKERSTEALTKGITQTLQIDELVGSWKEWNAYTSDLWGKVFELLPLWQASRMLVSYS